MIDAVILFGALNVLFELVLFSMIAPRTRLRVLGNERACTSIHFACLAMNLLIHWGTLIGTMSGIFAFVASIVTVRLARKLFGFVRGQSYHVGWLKYSVEELR